MCLIINSQTNLSQNNTSAIIRSIVACDAEIVSYFVLKNGFAEEQMGRWEITYRLKFSSEEKLLKFKGFGWRVCKLIEITHERI